jgi:hypothetical protein
MIPTKVYCNMDNLKIDNVHVEYGFRFKIQVQFFKITIVIAQIISLIMFSPFILTILLNDFI